MPALLRGLVAATHTPFRADGALATEVVPLQAQHLARQGVRTVFISGSTGESASLSREERERLFRAWSETAPKLDLTVIAHVGGSCLTDSRRLAEVAADLGLAGISALAPSYYRPADIETLAACCAEIAQGAPSLPFYYYDIPTMTGVRFPMDTFVGLARERIANFAGVKFTNEDLPAFRATLAAAASFDGEVAWGVDERLYDALGEGALGAVGSTYNFMPRLYLELQEARRAGDHPRAKELQADAVACIEALARLGYLGACKALMGALGVPVGPARLPLRSPAPSAVDAALADVRARRHFVSLA